MCARAHPTSDWSMEITIQTPRAHLVKKIKFSTGRSSAVQPTIQNICFSKQRMHPPSPTGNSSGAERKKKKNIEHVRLERVAPRLSESDSSPST